MSVDRFQRARELHDSHRGMWLVMWSRWKSEFVAFPCWPGTGGGMVVAQTPTELERRMALVELQYPKTDQSVAAATHPGSWPASATSPSP